MQAAKRSSISSRRLRPAGVEARASTITARASFGSSATKPSSPTRPPRSWSRQLEPGLGHRRLDPPAHSTRRGVEGGEEAVFLVLELLVEGRPRDPRTGEHVLDRQRVVADVDDRLDHRGQQPLALNRLDEIRRQRPHAGRETAVGPGQQGNRLAQFGIGPAVADRIGQLLPAQHYPLRRVLHHKGTYAFLLENMQAAEGYHKSFRRASQYPRSRVSLGDAAERESGNGGAGAEGSGSVRPALPREFIAQHKQRRIMDALAELAAEQGYEATKISDIVKRAGVARKTLYDNFEGKEEVFLAAFDSARDELMRGSRKGRRREGDWQERIEGGLAAFLGFVAEQPAVARMCMIEALSATPAATKRYEDAVDAFVELTRRSLPDDDRLPETIAETLVGGVAWIVYQQIRRGDAERAEDLLPELAEFMLAPYLASA